MAVFSNEQGLEERVIQHAVELKGLRESIDINPCTYSIATLKRCGLGDPYIAKAFGKMVRRKLKDRAKQGLV